MPENINYESGSDPVVDVYGHPIEVGSPVRYGGTGTTGYVTEIISDSEGAWVVIDTTGLLYKLESLTFLDKLEAKEALGEREFTREEIQEVLEKAEEEADKARLDDTNLEACG